MNAHLQKAQRLFGKNATVSKRSSGRFTSKGHLKGACSVCLKKDCRRKWDCTIAVTEFGGMFSVVKGRGHTWKDAWAKAEAEAEANRR